MKTLTLQRSPGTDQGTFGVIHSDDALLSLDTLELPWRDNHPQTSCIPEGDHICRWHQSPSKGWVYQVEDVPGRSNILIHAGNFAGDTAQGWDSDLEGCIAVGTAVGPLENKDSKIQQALYNSRLALSKLALWGDGEPFLLKIILP